MIYIFPEVYPKTWMARPTFLSASDELTFDDTLDLSPRMPVVNQGYLYQNPWEVNQLHPQRLT